MSRKHSTTDSRWGRYLKAGALLAVLVASGISAQLFATSDAPKSSSMEDADPTLYAHGHRLRPLVEETGGAQTLNIYGAGGRIIAQAARDDQGSQAVRYLLADHLGSTRAILDADGNVVARFEYGPHGETAAASGAAELRFRYTGHPWDEAQGLYQTPNRGYDPALGRFLSVDPRRQDASPYVYAGNNPVGFVDPTGGGKYPFYLFTGFETWQEGARARSHTADAVGSVFGRYDRGKQVALSADIFNFREDLLTRGISSMAEWKPGRYLNHDRVDYSKMYLFIGPDKAADEMGRLREGLTTFFWRRPEFARELTIINFSGNIRTGADTKKLFQNTGRYPLLVHAGLATDATRIGGQEVTSFTTDTGNYKPSEFVAHVHKLEKSHFPQLLTAQEETILGEPQDTTVHDIEVIDQGEVTGDLSQGFYHEGEFIQFPSVPPAQTTTRPATTLTGQSDHSTVPGFTDAQWKKFSEPLSPELVSVLGQTLGESWSTD